MDIDDLESERRDLASVLGNMELEIDVRRRPTKEALLARDNVKVLLEAVEAKLNSLLNGELSADKGRTYVATLDKFATLRNSTREKAKPTFDRYYIGYFEELYSNGITDTDSIWMLISKHM